MRELLAGDRLDHYKLTELLARSGMASIFKAVDQDTGATVAVKVPHMQYESDVAFYERFRREENIGKTLDHPNIVRVLDPGEKSRMYLVMQFAEGNSLRAVMSKAARTPVDEALAIARQICEALIYMHAHGVVHRDLKPENILIGPDNKVRLLDFGIALDAAARRLTWFGLSSKIGTPDYMAPEQIRGRRGDARTDIYALGTLLYEMLVGELPYPGSNAHVVMRDKVNQDPRPLRDSLPSLDPKIEEIVLRAIERSPRERYASAAEMLADLNAPTAVQLRDRSAQAARPLLEALHLPRRLLVTTIFVIVIGVLGMLTWLSARKHDAHHGTHHDAHSAIEPKSAESMSPSTGGQ